MRVLITGELEHAPTARAILDAAHNKRRISLLLHNGQSVAAGIAEQWANDAGVLVAQVEWVTGQCWWDIASVIIAFPPPVIDACSLPNADALLDDCRAHGMKIWKPVAWPEYEPMTQKQREEEPFR